MSIEPLITPAVRSHILKSLHSIFEKHGLEYELIDYGMIHGIKKQTG